MTFSYSCRVRCFGLNMLTLPRSLRPDNCHQTWPCHTHTEACILVWTWWCYPEVWNQTSEIKHDLVILILKHVFWFEHDGVTRSVGRAWDRHAANAGSIPPCGKGFLSKSQLSVQTLLRCPYSPRVQPHALTSVWTWKIPSNGSLTFNCLDTRTYRTLMIP